MEIIRPNSTSPDPYSIADIKVSCERNGDRVALYLIVSLKPDIYQRNCFETERLTRKKYPCELRIHLSEFHAMDDALRRELKDSYQFIVEHDLYREFLNHKYPPKEETKKAS
jgi:hypothetical protein